MATLSHSHPSPSPSEQTRAARVGAFLFRHRGILPLIVLAVPLIVPGTITARNWGIGVLMILIGETWRITGVAAAGSTTRRRTRNVQRLITYGPYAWSRNPLYNGNFLVWMGFAVISGVVWFLPAAAVLFIIGYSLIVRYEEGVLESSFGRDYLAYKSRTPRWIPRAPTASVVGDYEWADAWKSEISTFLQYAVLLISFSIKTILQT